MLPNHEETRHAALPRPPGTGRCRARDARGAALREGYVAAVKKAAEKALGAGFLLPEDAENLVKEAAASRVLR